jgi:hypothetical protein
MGATLKGQGWTHCGTLELESSEGQGPLTAKRE